MENEDEKYKMVSIESTPAIRSPTQARDLLVFNRKLVIISDFFSKSNVPLGINDYLFASLEVYDFGIAVRLHS